MKLRAMIEVEFEMEEGASVFTANAALIRGKGGLFHAIERGTNSVPTQVKTGSIKVQVVKQDIEE